MSNAPEVVRTITVPLDQTDAFRLFTEQFDLIKPREHNLLAVPVAETVMEVVPGGRILDRGTDGSECVWGEVVTFEPPALLRFSWFIGPNWQVQGRENASEVEVRFTPDGERRTLVELRHHHLDRHGPGWEHVHGGVAGDNGWPIYLRRFADLVDAAPH